MDFCMPRCFVKKNGFQVWRHSFIGFNKLTGEALPFFIEFYVLNPSLYPRETVFGQRKEKDRRNKDKCPSYVLVKAGAYGKVCKQIHQFLPAENLIINRKKFSLRIGDNILTDTELKGGVSMMNDNSFVPEFMSDCGEMKWNLRLQKIMSLNIKHSISRKGKNKIKWHIPGLKTQYAGAVMLDGEEYVIYPQKSFGFADCLWGKDFPFPWIHLAGCNLVSQISGKRLMHSAFASCGFFGGKNNKKITVCFNHEGTEYSFNNGGFSKKSDVSFIYAENEGIAHWTVTAQNKNALVDMELYAEKNEMLAMNYENPLGQKKYNSLLANGNSYGEIRLYKKVKKSLEIIEQAQIENAYTLYGIK